MASLTYQDLFKLNSNKELRLDVFIRKYKNGDSFIINKDKTSINLTLDEETLKTLESKIIPEIKKIKFKDSSGSNKTYKIGSFYKSKEFGRTHTLGDEILALNALKWELSELLKDKDYIDLKVNNVVYKVDSIENTKGNVKSDFHFLYKGNPVIFLSYKSGLTCKDFRQYGGLSETKISNHPEVQSFVNDIKEKYPAGVPKGPFFWRTVQDPILISRTIFGKDFSHKFDRYYGEHNCQAVIQGFVEIVDKGPYFELLSDYTLNNGEPPCEDYTPILTCSYRSSRNNLGMNNSRFLFLPNEAKPKKESRSV